MQQLSIESIAYCHCEGYSPRSNPYLNAILLREYPRNDESPYSLKLDGDNTNSIKNQKL